MNRETLKACLAGNLIALNHDWVIDLKLLPGEYRYACECLISTRLPTNGLCPNKVAAALRAVAEAGPSILEP